MRVDARARKQKYGEKQQPGQKKREIENINVCVSLMSIHFTFEILHYMSLSHLSVIE